MLAVKHHTRIQTVLQHIQVVLSLLGEQTYQLTLAKTRFEGILESVQERRLAFVRVATWRSIRYKQGESEK